MIDENVFKQVEQFVARSTHHVNKIKALPRGYQSRKDAVFNYQNYVEKYFVELISQPSNDDELRNTFSDYMKNQLIDSPSILRKIYERSNDDRTNNCCEIWHPKWYRQPGTSHTNINNKNNKIYSINIFE